MYELRDTRMLTMFQLIPSGRWRTVGDGSAWFHACCIDDLVAGFIIRGEHPGALGEVLILEGPDPVPLRDLVAEDVRVPDVRVPRGRMPFAPTLYAPRACERLLRPLGIEPPLHERRVRFFTNYSHFDGSSAGRLLGFVPAVPPADCRARTAAWYRQQGPLEGVAPA